MQPAQLSLPLLPDLGRRHPRRVDCPLPEPGLTAAITVAGRPDREGIDAERDRDRPRRGPGRTENSGDE